MIGQLPNLEPTGTREPKREIPPERHFGGWGEKTFSFANPLKAQPNTGLEMHLQRAANCATVDERIVTFDWT